MAFKVISRLTTKSDLTFNTSQEWLDHHGFVGQMHDSITDFSIVLEEDGISIIRTLVYDSGTDRELHRSERPENPGWTSVIISETIT